jgi:hypothetical protein
VLVRVRSHRAHNRIAALLGEPYYSFRRDGAFYDVREADAPLALAVKGVTRARWGDDLLRCWMK